MRVGRYVTWSDLKGHIDTEVAEPDMPKVAEAIAIAEDRFDNELRERYAVPFDATLHPEAYALAQQITGMWGAAWYLLNARQSETDEDRATWYADRLNAGADKIFEVFFEGLPPEDTPESADPWTELPEDGYDDLTSDEQASLEPIFKREHLRTGKSTHW